MLTIWSAVSGVLIVIRHCSGHKGRSSQSDAEWLSDHTDIVWALWNAVSNWLKFLRGCHNFNFMGCDRPNFPCWEMAAREPDADI